MKLCGFTNANLLGSLLDGKSTSGVIFSVGSASVSWYRRKKIYVALSSTEVEYMDASQVACEVIWMGNILIVLFGHMMDPTVIYYHNHSYIKLSENLVFHDRSRHIDIRYHHLWDCVQRKIMLLQYIQIEEKEASILTKVLLRGKFEFHRWMIGVVDNPFLTGRER